MSSRDKSITCSRLTCEVMMENNIMKVKSNSFVFHLILFGIFTFCGVRALDFNDNSKYIHTDS